MVSKKANHCFLVSNNPVFRFDGNYYMFVLKHRKLIKINDKRITKKTIERLKKFVDDNWLNFVPEKKSCAERNQVIVSLITTRNCNLWCVYCFAKWWEENSNLSFAAAKKLVDKVALDQPIPNIKITFFGWEPTMNFPLIKDVISYCDGIKWKNFSYHITTNWITSKENLLFLIKNKVDITISSDWYPAIQDKNRPVKWWWKSSPFLESSIKFLVENGKKFKVRITVTEDTVGKMLLITKYFHKLWCEILHFEPVNPSWRWDKMSQPDPKLFAKNFIKVLDFAHEHGMKIVNSAYLNLLQPACYYCWSIVGDKLILSPDGTISACFELQKRDQDSVFCIWQQKDSWELVYNVRNKEKLSEFSVENFEKCNECFAKYICSGWCPIRNFKHWTEDWPNEYWCTFKRIIIQNLLERIAKNSK